MNEKDIEKAKMNLKNVEFNNSEEDEEIIEEENHPKKDGNKMDDKSKLIIIICGIVIAILLLIIILFATGVIGGSKTEPEDKEPDSEDVTPIDPETKEETIEVATKTSYFLDDNYLYVEDGDNGYITGLEGNVVLKLDKKHNLVEGSTNYLVYRESNEAKNTKFIIKKVSEDRVIDVIKVEPEGSSGYLYDNKGNLVGVYDKTGSRLHVITNNVSKVIDLGSNMIYSFALAEGENKYIYNSRYAVILGGDNKYGLYDVKDEKILIEPSYEGIEYLYSDVFVGIKNGKSGLINSNNKVLLDFDYDYITYANGLYFVGYQEKIHILNSKYEEIGEPIEIDGYDDLTYHPCCGSVNPFAVKSFKNNIIIRLNNGLGVDTKYGVIDKNGKLTEYPFNNYSIYNNYLVTSKNNSTVVTMYDSNMKKVADYNTGRKDNDLDSAAIYLNNYFIINGRQLFELNTGKFRNNVSTLTRSYQSYMITVNITDKSANAVVTLDEQQIGTLENIDIAAFLRKDNNGIKLTKNYFILSLRNKNLIIKK